MQEKNVIPTKAKNNNKESSSAIAHLEAKRYEKLKSTPVNTDKFDYSYHPIDME